MAEECTQQIPIGASTSSMPNWWPDLHSSSLSSWGSCNTNSAANNHQLSCCEEDVSISTSTFTNASNHSGGGGGGGGGGLSSVDSSRHDLVCDSSSDHSHLWRHFLLNSGSSMELNNSHNLGENMTNTISTKCSSPGMFEPICNYLKKIDTNWDYSHDHNHFTNQNQPQMNINISTRLSNLSNLVNNWSIAPPTAPSETMNTNLCDMKQPNTINSKNLFGSFSPYEHENIKMVDESCNRASGYDQQMGTYNDHNVQLPDHVMEDHKGKLFGYHGMTSDHLPVGCFTEAISYSGSNTALCKPTHKASNFSTSSNRKSGLRSNNLPFGPSTRSSNHSTSSRNGAGARGGHGSVIEGKKKRNEENPETNNIKKPKNENSTVSSTKSMQVPKVKLTDKVTALQQIVSPFGKTDTASVLWEAIGYIKYLQEQIQLLSNPYMKTINKDSWGSMERNDRGDHGANSMVGDLVSRGLCLVPLSCTPQVYRETSGAVDYWTPTYRGCLYR